MIKVFSRDKIIYLISDKTLFREEKESVLVTVHSSDEMQLKYDELIRKRGVKIIWFYNKNFKKIIRYFYSMFRIIEAAGGLVKNKKGEWLFIFRNGKWDLPKGKIEKKESIRKAAKREVMEECGVKKLKIVKELPATYHTYFVEEKPVLKRTYWFEMDCKDTSKLVPQTEEGITDVRWIPRSKFRMVNKNVFESITEVMKEAEQN